MGQDRAISNDVGKPASRKQLIVAVGIWHYDANSPPLGKKCSHHQICREVATSRP